MTLTTKPHGGYAISTKPSDGLMRKIDTAISILNRVPLNSRNENWAAAVGGAMHAKDLLSEGRRAKAGKVLACACSIQISAA
ncbi:hypothetical protein [Polynucleobacter sp. UK-Kesae-W10]|uniref:hypothetical protein n=1 Tax=Polynucleobacter sp. UK-Kesae-W10 TaxID=1819738 RepID=UPI001C0D6AE9|nr:hypothetical protein [Polynucleobacter sp. UK-Kesae-W10]MBU3577561.1 hypothetical protein [Polynucleobacter sp. UK-Kesae-W10]